MPEVDANSLPTPKQSIRALFKSLKAVHPANMQAGVEALTPFIEQQMRDPEYKPEENLGSLSQLEEDAKVFPHTYDAYCGKPWGSPDSEQFISLLEGYAKLLYAVHMKLWELESTANANSNDARNEVVRIATALGVNVYEDDVYAFGHVTDLTINPIIKYLTETDQRDILSTIIRITEKRLGDLKKEYAVAVAAEQGEPAAMAAFAATLEPGINGLPLARTIAFDGCAKFDESLLRLQKRAEGTLRGFGQRVASLAQHCAEKINPSQRDAASAFGQQLETAVNAIKAK